MNKPIKVKLELGRFDSKSYKITSIVGAVTVHAFNNNGKPAELRVRDQIDEKNAKLVAADHRYEVTVTPAKE